MKKNVILKTKTIIQILKTLFQKFYLVIYLTTFKSKLSEPPPYYFLLPIDGFFVCVLFIFAEANEVVGVLTALGTLWNINNVIMGLTLLAWANSVGDFVADVSLARIGKARTAVS
jgi:sodium/potassium/calcium exchanger 6